ncbi:MAG: protein kinase, partial [Candidatus Latescibacterota bacterium]
TSDGVVKILDFGLAKSSARTQITKTGTTVGTVAYMSPEQARGEQVDQRTDIWSLGVLLYEMVTGEQPFKGTYEHAIVYLILNEEPKPVTSLRPDVSSGLERIVERALSKNLDERYENVNEFKRDLTSPRGLAISGVDRKTVAGRARPSIAVLRFRDMSAQKDQEYLCEGVAEDIINALTHVEGLQVAARTSAFSFKSKDIDIREIGRKLNVQTLLEGSIQKAGNRLRITAQLINVSDGYHIWSERYNRELEDVFAIQDEISLAIVDKLKVRLLGEERAKLVKRGTVNQDAYILYLKGRYFWNRRYEGGLQKAIEHFQQAIEKDPGFALAYSGLADSFGVLATYGFLPPIDAFTRAKKATEMALKIDGSLAEAVASQAYIRMFFDWVWPAAERGYKRAIDLNPNYETAHYWYGIFLSIMGRFDESIAEMKRARELEPLALIINSMLGTVLYMARRHDEAIEQYHKVIEMDPNFSLVYLFMGAAYLAKSMYTEAVKSSQKSVELTGGSPIATGLLGFSYAMSGDRAKALEMYNRLNEQSKERYVSPLYRCWIHMGLDEKEQALEHLEKACLAKESFVTFLKVMPLFDSLRSDAKCDEWLKRMRLDQ